MYLQCMVFKRRKTGREKLENGRTQAVPLKDVGKCCCLFVFFFWLKSVEPLLGATFLACFLFNIGGTF